MPHNEITQFLARLDTQKIEEIYFSNEGLENSSRSWNNKSLDLTHMPHISQILDNINPSISSIVSGVISLIDSLSFGFGHKICFKDN